jgi:hypothetical protein
MNESALKLWNKFFEKKGHAKKKENHTFEVIFTYTDLDQDTGNGQYLESTVVDAFVFAQSEEDVKTVLENIFRQRFPRKRITLYKSIIPYNEPVVFVCGL